MRHYWSCSKFADWVRGTSKPFAATTQQWNEWGKSARVKKTRYWLAEDGLDLLQDIIFWPWNFLQNINHYLHNRWISKTHALTSELKRGQYHEFETRLLHALFDELVNFVETELSEVKGRCPESGLAHLDWERQLKYDEDYCSKDDPLFGQPTPQALAAEEILALYKWWKEQRPKRQDPMDASGFSEYYERKDQKANDRFDILGSGIDDEARAIMETCRKIEEEQENEDTEMLIRLVKLRTRIWT